MALEVKYNAQNIENKWYSYWMENNYFHSEVDERESGKPGPRKTRNSQGPTHHHLLFSVKHCQVVIATLIL